MIQSISESVCSVACERECEVDCIFILFIFLTEASNWPKEAGGWIECLTSAVIYSFCRNILFIKSLFVLFFQTMMTTKMRMKRRSMW